MLRHIPWFFAEAAALDVLIFCSFRQFYFRGLSVFPKGAYGIRKGDESMDLVKIGKYLAAKRKALGLTQRELAEQLGMSDKSVSKWERGVCLPDVSLYEEYCAALGISLHEFLAGEDLAKEDLAKQAEENLLQVAADSKASQKRLKAVILALALTVLLVTFLGVLFLFRGKGQVNSLVPLDRNSTEMKTAELLSGVNGAFLFRYRTDDAFRRLTVTSSEYRAGEEINRENHVISYESVGSPSEGMIALVPDFERFTVKLVIADQNAKLSTEVPILDKVEDRTYYGRSASPLGAETEIRFDEEQLILALLYDDDVMHVLNLREFAEGNIPADNDVMYFFSVCFEK